MRFDYRHQYDDERDAKERSLTDIKNELPSLTQQHHAKDADINEMVKRFGITDGAIPPQALDPKYFGDFSDTPDLRAILEIGREAEAKFNALPAGLRKHFGNNPAEFLSWIEDPKNTKEAVELGLLDKFNLHPEPIRRRFKTPEALRGFLQDPENDAEAISLGLKTPPTPSKKDGTT